MAVAVCLAATAANAQNTNYSPGDLVLFFQKQGGGNTIYANLGNAAIKYRGGATGSADGANQVQFLNISAELTSAFGPGWASDPTVYAGLAGVWGTDVLDKVTLQNKDPNRTLYISKSRTSVGTVGSAGSTQWDLTLAGNTAMSSASSGIEAMNNVLEVSYTTPTAVVTTVTSQIDDQNPFIAPGIQGSAMSNALEGGVQQAGTSSSFGEFGAAGNVEFALDLYRVLAVNTAPGQVSGEVRIGSYEGTVTVDSSGLVSFIAQASAVPEAEISVQQPVGSELVDNKGKKSFGTVTVGNTGTGKTFTIKNTGSANLTGISITKSGADLSNFIVTAPGQTSLTPNASTTFKVSFKPKGLGTRTATLHVHSNDADEASFEIKLAGSGAAN